MIDLSFQTLKPYYTSLIATCSILPVWDAIATHEAGLVHANETRYHVLPNIPWYVIGLIHLMEGGLSFGTYLGNGQRLDHRTTLVPKGRGPFQTWESGALDALHQSGLDLIQDWCDEQVCYQLEKYNGWGYHMKSLTSPYLWSGTNHYTKGKYEETVNGSWYDPNAISRQCGAIPVLLKLKGML